MKLRENMIMYQVWMKTWEAGVTDTVIYLRAVSIEAAYKYCYRFRATHAAKTFLTPEEWIKDEITEGVV